ncbi:hypothetical protein AQUCO_01700590v1 [Aquilegia coerulea]|uniref:BHLH domain-containing protein n=1 Tax=Aquilegia coerulea TaxID=218851 RepID=A0A2G5DNQ9_AQUCA|nr:hypothetical protein AQUCO_01700590v1 [Aquilegia coerulea]
MANNNNPTEGLTDDFLDQILSYGAHEGNLAGNDVNLAGTTTPGGSMALQLSSSGGDITGSDEASGSGKRFRDDFVDLKAVSSTNNDNNDRGDSVHLNNLFPAFGHVQQQQQAHSVRPPSHQNQINQPFLGHPTPGAVAVVPHPPAIRPRVRARRGQATDPHSIAERLRRERIAERMKALQELVPSSNKTDRAAMLDEIVDYVKFLRLQVKVLSMSRLGGAGAVAQLVADIPLSSAEGGASEGGSNQPAWEKWSTDGTEHQVAKLMEEDVGAAMQFLQSKALCIMPISLASAIYHDQPPDASTMIKPEPNAPS